MRPARPYLRTRARNPHLEDGCRGELRSGRRVAAVLPAVGQQVVRDAGHGVEALGVVGDERGVAICDRGAVVAAVVEGGEGEDEAVHES